MNKTLLSMRILPVLALASLVETKLQHFQFNQAFKVPCQSVTQSVNY